jgi:hypothetical protein
MRETSNPVVGTIQSELLSYFEERMSDLFYQLDHMNAEFYRYSSE